MTTQKTDNTIPVPQEYEYEVEVRTTDGSHRLVRSDGAFTEWAHYRSTAYMDGRVAASPFFTSYPLYAVLSSEDYLTLVSSLRENKIEDNGVYELEDPTVRALLRSELFEVLSTKNVGEIRTYQAGMVMAASLSEWAAGLTARGIEFKKCGLTVSVAQAMVSEVEHYHGRAVRQATEQYLNGEWTVKADTGLGKITAASG